MDFETEARLRGIGRAATKLGSLKPWPACRHMSTTSTLWFPHDTLDRRRIPDLGAQYAITDLRTCAVDPADCRAAQDVVGVSTRACSRQNIFCGRR